MGTAVRGYLDDVYHGFDRLIAADTGDELSAAFSATIAPFGCENFVIASSRLEKSLFGKMIILEHWPRAWIDRYQRENMIVDDPVALLVRAQCKTFWWNEAAERYPSRTAQRVMRISADEHNLREGISVPIHGLSGYEGTISVAGPAIERSKGVLLAIEMAGMATFRTALRLRPKSRGYVLTAREREVMQWAAAGKTAWDTSEILRISEQTVKTHIVSACSKLQVCSKIQAVAESIRLGEIRI
jgi:LuxR family quorum sensing-dependent transcriptional regulator